MPINEKYLEVYKKDLEANEIHVEACIEHLEVYEKYLKVYIRISNIINTINVLKKIPHCMEFKELTPTEQEAFTQGLSLFRIEFFFLSNIVSTWVIDNSPGYIKELENLEEKVQHFYNSAVNSLDSTVTTTEPSL